MELKEIVMKKCTDTKPLNPEDHLRGWLASRGISNTEIAQYMGTTLQFVGHVLNGITGLPYKRWVQLKELGIPEELLPVPNKPRGGSNV